MGQDPEAVLRLPRPEVHLSVDGVGVAAVDQPLDEGDDVGDMLRDLGIVGRRQDVQGPHVLEEGVDVELGKLERRLPCLRRPLDDHLLDVREVLHVGDPEAERLQVPAGGVEGDVRTGMSQVAVVVGRRPAHVHFHVAGRPRPDALKGLTRRPGHIGFDGPGCSSSGRPRNPLAGRRRNLFARPRCAGRCWADRSAEDRRLRKAEAVGSNPTRSTPATRSSPSQRRSRPTPKPFRIVSERGNSYFGSLEMTTLLTRGVWPAASLSRKLTYPEPTLKWTTAGSLPRSTTDFPDFRFIGIFRHADVPGTP